MKLIIHNNSPSQRPRILNMCLLITPIILFSSIHTALGQSAMDSFKQKPEKCYGTYELTDRRCCIFPPFFNRASARQCGARLALMSIDNKFNVTTLRREIEYNCDYWRCILRIYQILDDEDKLIYEKYNNHLDNWASLNHDFSDVLTTAKLFCHNIYKNEMPMTICKFNNFQSCIRNYVNVDCPKIIQTKECFEWKEFYEECKEFFI